MPPLQPCSSSALQLLQPLLSTKIYALAAKPHFLSYWRTDAPRTVLSFFLRGGGDIRDDFLFPYIYIMIIDWTCPIYISRDSSPLYLTLYLVGYSFYSSFFSFPLIIQIPSVSPPDRIGMKESYQHLTFHLTKRKTNTLYTCKENGIDLWLSAKCMSLRLSTYR